MLRGLEIFKNKFPISGCFATTVTCFGFFFTFCNNNKWDSGVVGYTDNSIQYCAIISRSVLATLALLEGHIVAKKNPKIKKKKIPKILRNFLKKN